MTSTAPLTLMGAPGSPYTRKMLAVLRYRRIPYRLLTAAQAAREGLPAPKVGLLPTFYLPGTDGAVAAVTDSTPLIRRFEAERAGRSLIPADPALRVLDELLEDYGDEWLTKAMFHYRWAYAEDVDRAAHILPLWRNTGLSDAALAAAAAMIGERQIGRLGFVGSNAVTGPVIEAGYARFLTLFEAHLKASPFLLGARPGSGDFAVFGQMTQLALFDPTPMALTLKIAPRAFAWTGLMEDLSGLEAEDADWTPPEAIAPTLTAILREVGRTYVPVMLANARALAAGADQVAARVDGAAWTQSPFPYQAKCLRWLRASRESLEERDRARFDGMIAGTGCEALFA